MSTTATWQSRRPPDLTTCLVWSGALAFALAMLIALGLWIAQASPAISEYGQTLVTGQQWFYRHQLFGAAGMIYGSIVVSLLAFLLATPLAFGTAIYLSEYLPAPARPWAKTAVEFLAAIPSVVYGLLGVILLRNWMADFLSPFDPLSGDMLATAAVLLAVMILPTVTTFAEDSLRTVPAAQRLAARALALNKSQTIRRIVLPQAWPGMVGAALLGIGRALGETIAVLMVVGNVTRIPTGVFQPGYPLPALIANNYGEMLSIPLYDSALMLAALILFLVVLMFNVLSRFLILKAETH